MSYRYNLWQSLEKMFSYIHAVSAEDISLEFRDKKLMFPKFDSIEFGNSFFRDFSCLRCGSCCKTGFYIILTKSDFEKTFTPVDEISVNNEFVPIYTRSYLKDKSCPFLKRDVSGYLCSIHGFHQVTCHAPHRFPRKIDNKIFWVKRQYGRNWGWKDRSRACPAKPLIKYSDEERKGDIEFFLHLQRVCEDLKLRDVCSQLIEQIKLTDQIKFLGDLTRYVELEV